MKHYADTNNDNKICMMLTQSLIADIKVES